MSITIYPTLHFLARPDLTPGALSVSRKGTATRIDARGRVAEVPADVLRHDFDPSSGVYRGWLVEEGRANHLLHSRDLSNGAWTRDNVKVSRAAKGLDGAETAATVVAAAAAAATLFQPVNGPRAAYTLSLDLKRVSGDGAVFLTLDGGASWTNIAASIPRDRFARVHATQTVDAPAAGLKIAEAGDTLIVDYVQLETGAFATSRIPTAAAPMSRGADVLSAPAGAWFNPDEGALYIEAMLATGDAATKTLFSSCDDPDAVEASVGDLAQGIAVNAGAIGSGFSGCSPSRLAVETAASIRLCLIYDAARGGAFIQGGEAFHRFSAGKRWDTTTLAFGCQLRDGPKRFLNGWLRHVAAFPRRLSEDQAKEVATL